MHMARIIYDTIGGTLLLFGLLFVGYTIEWQAHLDSIISWIASPAVSATVPTLIDRNANTLLQEQLRKYKLAHTASNQVAMCAHSLSIGMLLMAQEEYTVQNQWTALAKTHCHKVLN